MDRWMDDLDNHSLALSSHYPGLSLRALVSHRVPWCQTNFHVPSNVLGHFCLPHAFQIGYEVLSSLNGLISLCSLIPLYPKPNSNFTFSNLSPITLILGASPVAQSVKNLPAMQKSTCNPGDLGSISGSGRSPAEGNGNHSSILTWEIPWTEETGRLQSPGSQGLMTQQLNHQPPPLSSY